MLERFLELRPGDKQTQSQFEQLQDRETATVFGAGQASPAEPAEADGESWFDPLSSSRPTQRRRSRTHSRRVIGIIGAGPALLVVIGLVVFPWPTTPNPKPVQDQEVAAKSVQPVEYELRGLLKLTLKGHTGLVWGVVFSPEGRRIGTSSCDGSVKLWDVTTGEEVREFTGHRNRVYGLSMSPDGRLFASAGSGGAGGATSFRDQDLECVDR